MERVADLIQSNSDELLYLLMHETGKTIHDAWDELREGEDFLRFYAAEANKLQSKNIELKGPTGELNELSYHAKGNILCISPWNFPVAILVGQISAALVTGNNVIAKPSENSSLLGYKIIELFYEAGVPKSALKLIMGGADQGNALSLIDDIHTVSFTGSHLTAQSINKKLASKIGPITPIIAETGGLNVMIVDSSALLEQVTDDVIRSSFNSAGQRCSALRLILVQEEIYEDLWGILTGAMKEMVLDTPNNFETDVGPIINQKAYKKLSSYIESFSQNNKKFQPHEHIPSKNIIGPCLIELNSLNEINEEQFGPILHIYKYNASSLNDDLKELNKKNYGLTLGVHSRIESKHEEIASYMSVGNSYINRDMVGAVVGVQPFGGEGLSGCGLKAGGPNYLLQFVNERVISKNTVAFGGNTELLNLDKE
jgi:RHH-type proline utilization regulon transcriptional repressor/proline dehydrogenase/delta 1-pyrroline-5-carboxylate dehydrogenase